MALSTNANLITTSKVTKETLAQLVNSLVVASRCDWSYSDQFANAAQQIGDRLSIRRPILSQVRTDSMTWTGALPYEAVVTLIVDKSYGVDLKFLDTDRTLKIEQFSDRFIKQAVVSMANKMDSDVYGIIINNTANTVGQYGDAITSDTLLEAGELLRAYNCPDDGDIYGILTPKQNRAISNAQLTLFNAQKEVSEIYKKGRIGEFAGVDWAWSNSSPTHIDGTWAGSPTISGNATSNVLLSGWAESSTLTVNGFTTGATLNAGDVFTISGTYAYNPLTKATLPYAQKFVVLTAVGSATSASQSVVVSPALITSGDYKNVDIQIGGTTPLVKYSSTGKTTGQEGLVFHKKAVAIASPMLFKPTMTVKCESMKDEDTGINVRFMEGFDITGAYSANRVDSILGVKVVRNEWVVRVR